MTTYEKTGTLAAGAGAAIPSAPPAYLDTVLIIGLAKQDLPPEEGHAMMHILQRYKTGTLSLCTSHLAKDELTAYAAGADPTQEVIYMLLVDVPAIPEEFNGPPALGTFAFGAAGPVIRDAMLGKLMELLPHADDARHIFQAAKNEVDYFVTDDRRSILRHASAIEPVAGIRLRSPSQLVADLAASES